MLEATANHAFGPWAVLRYCNLADLVQNARVSRIPLPENSPGTDSMVGNGLEHVVGYHVIHGAHEPLGQGSGRSIVVTECICVSQYSKCWVYNVEKCMDAMKAQLGLSTSFHLVLHLSTQLQA